MPAPAVLKLHLRMIHDKAGRSGFEVTSAKVDDVVAGRTVPLEAGATYVFDKGYYGLSLVVRDPDGRSLLRHPTQAQCTLPRNHGKGCRGRRILFDRRLKIGQPAAARRSGEEPALRCQLARDSSWRAPTRTSRSVC